METDKWKIYDYERIDDLIIGGLYIIQDTRGFCFGTDAVLLSDFAEIKRGDRVMDLCTGGGIVPLLLHAKTKAGYICGVEIMEEAAQMAQRSVKYNEVENVEIFCGDLKDAPKNFGCGRFDAVTCNPPYERAGGGLVSSGDSKAAARHEIFCTLDDVVKSASLLLKYGGRFFMVHRANRLADIICTLRKYSLEPKRLRFAAPREGSEPNLVFIDASKGGGAFLKVMPTLYIYKEDGGFADEINRIYGRE